MAFEPGQKKIGGRKVGSKNKVQSPIRDFLNGVIDDNREKFQDSLGSLKGARFVKAYLETLQYALPKLRQVELKDIPDLERFVRMSPEERAELLKQFRSQKAEQH